MALTKLCLLLEYLDELCNPLLRRGPSEGRYYSSWRIDYEHKYCTLVEERQNVKCIVVQELCGLGCCLLGRNYCLVSRNSSSPTCPTTRFRFHKDNNFDFIWHQAYTGVTG